MNVSAWAVRNPVPVVLMFVLLLTGGLISFSRLAVQSFPDLDLPLVFIDCRLDGAAPDQLETDAVRKIEDKVATLGKLNHITTRIDDGRASVIVEFPIDKDPQAALEEVRNAVDGVRADLPADMETPGVSRQTVQDTPLMVFTAASDRLDEATLSWFVDNDLARALRSVPGVGDIARLGGVDREVAVTVDPTRLAAFGLTIGEVADRLRAAQIDASGGRVETTMSRSTIRLTAAANGVDALRALPLPLLGGASVPLGEVATVEDAHADRTSLAYQGVERVIAVEIKRSNGYSDIDVAEGTRAAVARLAADHPEVRLAEATTTVDATLNDYHASMHMLYEGIGLAVLVVWAFLGSLRATLVAAAALPLALIPAFMAMEWFGFSLNSVSLLALSLVIGVLVDDAIVEVENIERHLRNGGTPREATIAATQEIGLAVVATTLTLVAVFLPTAFIGDVPGLIFRQFGITASAAVLASLLVARLLTPMMAAKLLKPKADQAPVADGPIMRAYLRLVRLCLGHRAATLVAAAMFVAASFALVPLLDTAFVPPSDIAQTTVQITLQPGSSLAATDATARQAAKLIGAVPDVRSVLTRVGTGAVAGAGPDAVANADVTSALFTVDLTPYGKRPRSQQMIEQDIRDALAVLPGVRVAVGGSADGVKLDVVLAGNDAVALGRAAGAIESGMRTIPGLGAVTSTAALEAPEVAVAPDLARAGALGVTPAAIAAAVRIASAGDYAANLPKLNLGERQLPIRMRLPASTASAPEALASLRVGGKDGSVALGAVADIAMRTGPTAITRLDRERNVIISAELNGRNIGAVTEEVTALPAARDLPAGVRLVDQGEVERMDGMFSGFLFAFVVGVLCIYGVLVLLFRDFLQPFTILTAIPLSLGGALLPLVVTGTSFSIATAIGMLMLVGIVTKNSILIVEYAVAARLAGQSRLDALIDACHKRARPVVMTTLAMIGGMAPVVLGLSGGDPSFRRPMGLTVIGGLALSTLLSLIVVPAVYSVVDGLSRRLKREEGTQATPSMVPEAAEVSI
ncbi:efflux RND transporter permease subunit [Pleomorphomonas koreensis]|uniref:efflux RND transporter permease subunit n=1 Tax=Pleomorphomonas koreensis TaxID=257440 RepID=UPI000421052C|nr:efflux RND transporter permease subunit [Pleomorphomonas koreensis]